MKLLCNKPFTSNATLSTLTGSGSLEFGAGFCPSLIWWSLTFPCGLSSKYKTSPLLLRFWNQTRLNVLRVAWWYIFQNTSCQAVQNCQTFPLGNAINEIPCYAWLVWGRKHGHAGCGWLYKQANFDMFFLWHAILPLIKHCFFPIPLESLPGYYTFSIFPV